MSISRDHALSVVSQTVGWIYFAAWSISFYFQVFLNYRRKSVRGLSFDFLAYNFTGFLCYTVFNCTLYWSAVVQEEYKQDTGSTSIGVKANDVAFAVHALVITCFTIFQCFIYERGDQRISITAWIILSLTWAFMLVTLFLGVGGVLNWYKTLTFLAYVKMWVSLIKYAPQAWSNFKRKSTVGWSIGNILLDCTGGTLSILQLILDSIREDDWNIMFGDIPKLGLGFESVFFDIFFMVQHYCLYTDRKDRDAAPTPVAEGGAHSKYSQLDGTLPFLTGPEDEEEGETTAMLGPKHNRNSSTLDSSSSTSVSDVVGINNRFVHTSEAVL